MLLIAGGQQEVLQRAEDLTAGLEAYRQRGVLKSIFSPTNLLPSVRTQQQRAASLANIDLAASARVLEDSLRENGFRTEPQQPFIDRLRNLAQGAEPITLEEAAEFLPPGLVEFSFDKINRDMQSRVLHDSRRALVWTAAAIVLIVYLCFRNLRVSLVVLMPIAFAIIVTFGLLLLVRHRFSFMSITAIPLIIGIGIDNGIHLVRRYLENESNGILATAKASGAALIQSNLTTIIGFGALMASSFAPLAEMGLVTSLGVALALAGGLWLVPAVILLGEETKRGEMSRPTE